MHILKHCQQIIAEDDNIMIHSTPTEEEIKNLYSPWIQIAQRDLMDSMDFFIRETKQETINHLFIASDLAKRVWQQITSPLELQLTNRNMENMLDQWWTLPPKNVVHRFLLLITPSLYVGKSGKQGAQQDLSISRSEQIAFATKFSFRLKNRCKTMFSRMDQQWDWK